MTVIRSTATLVLTCLMTLSASAQPAPTPLDELAYDAEFFAGSSYDSSIPTPESLLGFRPGDRAALPAEIERCLRAWDTASPRARLVEYARSHEGRALHYMIVTSPANLERLDEIQAGARRLADPRGLGAGEAEALLDEQPAVAWMAYSIHGDETSGSDGSLAVLYHLIAGTGPEVTGVLDEVVVLIDSMQNPDGRQRFLQQIAEHRATTPNVDDQSLLHGGYWPWGRTNHYLFDLNRDWTLGVHPESRGRIAAAGAWHPQLMVDAHEMGSQDTFLFSPARDPRNPHLPPRLDRWSARFAREQSEAFDRRGWVYYTGEWNEGWYPGYTDAWGAMRGAIGILYEQASYGEDGVRYPGGDIVTYREAVHHQAVSSIANLTSLKTHRRAILEDYLADRRTAVAATGEYADRVFAVLPSTNSSRVGAFTDLLHLQGFEFYRATATIEASSVVDQYGRQAARRSLPVGTLLIPNRQPEARLIATMLEFDQPMSADYLARERTSILRTGQSTIYDTTAWNTTMAHGLEAVTFEGGLPASAERVDARSQETQQKVPEEAVAWVVDGADDASVAAAARWMERGVAVRVADRAIELGEDSFARGSVVVLPADNRRFAGDLSAAIEQGVAGLGLEVRGVSTGLGEGELPDLGGGHFRRLEPPRIALLTRGGLSFYDYGSVWNTLDQQLAIRHSQLDETTLNFVDLRRYNVAVLPDRFFSRLSDSARTALETWVRAGGTLIAIGGSAAEIASADSSLTSVRRLRDVLGELDGYENAVLREEMGRAESMPATASIWAHAVPGAGDYPWDGLAEVDRPSQDALDRNDAWDRMFMPQGAYLAGRTDGEHWLTFGVGSALPVLVGREHVLMARHPVEAAVRLGLVEPIEAAPARRLGWSVVPAGQDLRLRMSGLLWPEAARRLANSAALTRESVGSGQVILFADTPTFRGSTLGTARLLLNAMIYGPGFGASAPIEP